MKHAVLVATFSLLTFAVTGCNQHRTQTAGMNGAYTSGGTGLGDYHRRGDAAGLSGGNYGASGSSGSSGMSGMSGMSGGDGSSMSGAMAGGNGNGAGADTTRVADRDPYGEAWQGSREDPTSFAAISRDLTPSMKTLIERPVDVDSHLAYMKNTNWRNFWLDLGRVFYTDHPSHLSPFPIPDVNGNPR